MADAAALGSVRRLPQPSPARLVLAFLAAPGAGWLAFHVGILTAAAVYASGSTTVEDVRPALYIYSAVALTFAFGGTLVFGVPLYFVLRHRFRPTLPLVALLAGVLAVAVPFLSVLVALGSETPFSDPLMLLLIFACGVVGGIVFWLCAYWRDPAFARP